MSADDAPNIAGLSEPDGVNITISRPVEAQGVNGSGGTQVEIRASADGPLMRFLTLGHL
jgi:hypothetical protein